MFHVIAFLATQLTATPDAAGATTVLRESMAAMNRVVVPPFLTFDDIEKLTTRAGSQSWTGHVEERTSDRMARFQWVRQRATAADVRVDGISLGPDAFLRHAAQPARPMQTFTAGTLPLIARVVAYARRYDVTFAAPDADGVCGGDIHLVLRPVSEPMKYNLREVWISPTTRLFCRAKAVWEGQIGVKRLPLVVSADFDSAGRVTHWTAAGTARYLLFAKSVQEEVWYTHIQAVEDLPPAAFRE